MKTRTPSAFVAARPGLAALVLAVALPAAAQWTTIYQHGFGGSAADSLNGVSPDVRPGAQVWTLNNTTAFEAWRADGSVLAGGGVPNGRSAMQLPFTPVAGTRYQLTVALGPVSATDNNQWIGTGFSTALNNADGASGLWAFGAGINGVSWLILRNPATGGQFDAFAGPATAAGIGGSWAGGNPLAVRVLLDTTDAAWTTSLFVTAANINGGNETQLGATYTYAVNPTINAVGFTKGDLVNGSVSHFRLEVIPEPSAASLLALGALALGYGRRRR